MDKGINEFLSTSHHQALRGGRSRGWAGGGPYHRDIEVALDKVGRGPAETGALKKTEVVEGAVGTDIQEAG